MLGCINTKDKPVCELENIPSNNIEELYSQSKSPFYHGVASGDPLSDKVILWTHVTPKHKNEIIAVSWEVANDINFTDIVCFVNTKTDENTDLPYKLM